MNTDFELNKLIFIEANKDNQQNFGKRESDLSDQSKKRRRRRTGVFLSNQKKDEFRQKQIIKDFEDFTF